MTTGNHSSDAPMPLEQWAADMQAAVDEIVEVGAELLKLHRQSSQRASEVADQWKLDERLDAERSALGDTFHALRRILSAIEKTRHFLNLQEARSRELDESMRQCAAVIESELPAVQSGFLTIRHSALDLLRWVHRFGEGDRGGLESRYRSSYGRLLAYTPIFRPRLEAMQDDLLRRSRGTSVSPELQRMLTQLQQYSAAIELARAFVKSVVDPPMDLVFHDTESFQADWKQIASTDQGHLATQLNDRCQLLLYDMDGFYATVDNVQRQLAEGVDAAVYVLPVDSWRVLFTMDEDPVFRQLIVSLLRVVPVEQFNDAIESVFEDLYRDFSKT